ncbi:hypothetical protein Q7C36_019298 [Tachysurus vachellii]|uniref:Uncharacterized protein n=1 Tax=Tachysurus vachellii TaxID=175792 RepID=A0AA88LW65_TACVA|nr:hypothetical protein Q7C36_019298 [Tachysurus vachellii]
MLTMHYTGQLLSGELEKGKEKEKEIRKRWKGRGKEGERWDRIVLVEGEGVQRMSVRACWLFKLHSSAVFPYCRSSSCMSECAVTFKGERNLEGHISCRWGNWHLL